MERNNMWRIYTSRQPYFNKTSLPGWTLHNAFIDSGYVDVDVIVCPEHEPRGLPVAVEVGPVQAQEVLESHERLHCVVTV